MDYLQGMQCEEFLTGLALVTEILQYVTVHAKTSLSSHKN